MQVILVNKEHVHIRNHESQARVPDLHQLRYLHEPAIVYNLHSRFELGQVSYNNTFLNTFMLITIIFTFLKYTNIFTYCGTALIAVNPYSDLQLYGDTVFYYYEHC